MTFPASLELTFELMVSIFGRQGFSFSKALMSLRSLGFLSLAISFSKVFK